jgi:hypothetical protein
MGEQQTSTKKDEKRTLRLVLRFLRRGPLSNDAAASSSLSFYSHEQHRKNSTVVRRFVANR